MKRILIAFVLSVVLGIGLVYAGTYDEFMNEQGKLKVGKVYYKRWTMERLLQEKEMIEEEFQRAQERYNKDLLEINTLITEAGKLGVTAVSP